MALLQDDRIGQRLPIALAGSLALNVLLWAALSKATSIVPVPKEPPVLEFERVQIDKNETKPIPPKPKPLPKPPKPVEVKPKVQPKAAPPPPAPHNRVLTIKDTHPSPEKSDFQAQKGGNAAVGVPLATQGSGNTAVPAPAPVAPQPTPTPTAPPAPKPAPAPAPTPAPAPAQPKPEPAPPPPPPPKPKGETRDAVPSNTVNVEIPDSLKNQSFKSFVRVTVSIAADGSFDVTLRTSSGNPDIDKLVIDTLKKWTWKPALKDGEPVDSVQKFRFNITVN